MAVAIRLWESPGAVHCRLHIPLRIGGYLSIVATIKNADVLQALKRYGVSLAQGKTPEEVGSLFSAIGKIAKKVAKSSVMKKALALGKAVINSPIVKLVAPQAAAAIAAASMAAKLVQAARGKDPKKAQKAKVALAAATAQAKAENAAGKQLPLPQSVAARSDATKLTYRYLVTVARAAA
jgi:hypothetical protein